MLIEIKNFFIGTVHPPLQTSTYIHSVLVQRKGGVGK